MTVEITPLYGMALTALMFVLWLNVVKRRGAAGISIGHGGDTDLLLKIRQHGNFIEFVPMVLLLMMLAELRDGNATALHVAGILLVTSRALHPFGLHPDRPTHVLRIIGNTGSLIALFIATGVIVTTYLG